MKTFGSAIDFTHARNAELMMVFRRKLAEASVINLPEIYAQVASSPASRFWVSERRATIVISAMASGRPLSNMTASKRAMFHEIFRRYLRLRAERPFAPMLELVSTIVHQPAPSFYFTPRTVGEIIRRIRRGFYDTPYYAKYRYQS